MPEVPKGIGTVPELMKRFGEARKRWELWRSLHQEAFDFAAPERETFHFRSPGQRKSRHIFDSTAVEGLSEFASLMQGSLVPSWQEWMKLEAGTNTKPEDREKTSEKLEESTTIFFDSLNHSNFSTEITPSFSDVGIGTGGIMIEEGDFAKGENFTFTNIPLAELYPERNLKTVWRHYKIEVRQIRIDWPEAELPPSLINMEKNKPFTEVSILNGIVYDHTSGIYHQVVIFEKDKKLIFTQPFNTQRLIVFRWHVTPGEVFGRGPIIQLLADIRTANKVKQFILENAAIQMAGVYTGKNDGLFNPHTVRIAPGSIIPVNSNSNADPSLRALPRSGDIGLGDIILEDLRAAIKRGLFVQPLGDMTDPVRSATEIQIRMQEMLKRAGASIGRMMSELLVPLVAAGVDILSSKGLLPDVKVDGKDVTLKQTSPLAKAADLEDFQNSQTWFAAVTGLAEIVGPEVILGTVKVEELPQYWAKKLGVPTKLTRDDTEKEQFGKTAVEAAQTIAAQEGGQGGGSQPV